MSGVEEYNNATKEKTSEGDTRDRGHDWNHLPPFVKGD